jgi:O-antigen/teichoic acid export membrane protein
VSNTALDPVMAREAGGVEQHLVSAAKGGGITFAGKLFTFGCRLVITLLLARMLGVEQYGLYNLGLTALTMTAALAAFGLDTALVRYIAVYAGRRDEARVWGTLQIALGVSLALSLGLAAGLYALAEPIAVGVFGQPRLAPLLQVAAVTVPFLTLLNMFASATQGFKKMQYATLARDVAQPLLRLVLTLALVVIGASAIGAVSIYGLSVAVAALILLLFLHRRLFSLRRPLASGTRETREVLGFSVPVFLSDLMTTFRDNIQTLLLGAMSTVASVGIFAVASQLNMVGHMFQSAVAASSRPIIAELYDRGEIARLGQMYRITTKWTLTLNLPVFLTLVLFPEQILAVFGNGFVAGAPTLVLLAWAIMADISTGQCGIILDMAGRTGWKLVNSIVRLGLSLALSGVLIPAWGVFGAGVATLATVALVNLMRVLQVFLMFRLLPYDASFVKPLAAAAAGLLAALTLGPLLPASPLSALAQGATLFGVYAATVLALGLSSEDRLVLARLRGRLRLGPRRS